jgi:hypothetical protein
MRLWTALKTSAVGIFGYCNLAVERANNGDMPAVYPDCASCAGRINVNHVFASASTRLLALCDWIPFDGWLYSPGDVLLFAGKWLTILAVAMVLWMLIDHVDQLINVKIKPKGPSHW